MPVLDVHALQRAMIRRNYLFKHQLANLVGISYDRLADMMVNGQTDVDDDTIRRLCLGLECEPADIVADGDAPAS